MPRRVTILGGGHGVAAVLRALGGLDLELAVIVTVADDGGSSGELRRHWGTPAVGDMRRSLIALLGEQHDSGRALAAPVMIARLGRHPLGNLLLHSLTKAFGDLQTASEWLSGQLSLSVRVLPATTAPVTLLATTADGLIRGESAIGATQGLIQSLNFDPPRPEVPAAAIDAINHADWVLLGPGSLFTSVLAVCALPAVAQALADTPARVLWICNLEPELPETAGMSAADHLGALRRHNIRVDTVLYDPATPLHFTRPELVAAGLPGVASLIAAPHRGEHDPALLSAALEDLFAGG
ncbi:MAG: gluconeogenesis factor YvcK family protein [Solirubrobacteraceae bacterium]